MKVLFERASRFKRSAENAKLRRFGNGEVFLVAVFVSLAVTAYHGWFGSIEPEESMHIAYSIAAGTGERGMFDGPREQGTFSVLGVPLYDGLQGVGARLPYKGAWFSSVEWPLRLVLNWRLYVMVRIFLSTLVFLWLSLVTLKSWSPGVSGFKLMMTTCLLVAPAPQYLRWEEWSVEWSQSAATLGIGMFLLRRDFFYGSVERESVSFPSGFLFVALALALSYLTSGHPGFLPVSAFVLIPLVASGFAVSQTYRIRLFCWIRNHKFRLCVLITPAVLSILSIAYELRLEFVNQSSWVASRRLETAQTYSDQAFLGIGRGFLPSSLERLMSELFSQAFFPLARLLFQVFPEVDAFKRTGGSFPHGQFTVLLVPIGGLYLLFKIQRDLLERKLIVVTVLTNTSAVVLARLAVNGFLPLAMTPSGAWKIFPLLLPLNIFMAVVLLSSRTGRCWFTRLYMIPNLALVLIYLLMQLDFLAGTGVVQFPKRIHSLIKETEAEQLPSQSRTAFVAYTTPGDDGTMLSTQSFGIPLSGKPLLHSAAIMRNTSNMKFHLPTEGGFGFIDPNGRSTSELTALLSFFQVETVLVQDDAQGRKFVTNTLADRTARIPVTKFRGYEFLVWNRMGRFSDAVIYSSLFDGRTCPALDRRCPVIFRTGRANYSDSPKLRTCSDPCLWEYHAGKLKKSETLVIPVSFDAALKVTDGGNRTLPVRDVAGFLGISDSQFDGDEVLRISIKPDQRMWILVAVSYVSVLCPILLFVLYRKKVK